MALLAAGFFDGYRHIGEEPPHQSGSAPGWGQEAAEILLFELLHSVLGPDLHLFG